MATSRALSLQDASSIQLLLLADTAFANTGKKCMAPKGFPSQSCNSKSNHTRLRLERDRERQRERGTRIQAALHYYRSAGGLAFRACVRVCRVCMRDELARRARRAGETSWRDELEKERERKREASVSAFVFRFSDCCLNKPIFWAKHLRMCVLSGTERAGGFLNFGQIHVQLVRMRDR